MRFTRENLTKQEDLKFRLVGLFDDSSYRYRQTRMVDVDSGKDGTRFILNDIHFYSEEGLQLTLNNLGSDVKTIVFDKKIKLKRDPKFDKVDIYAIKLKKEWRFDDYHRCDLYIHMDYLEKAGYEYFTYKSYDLTYEPEIKIEKKVQIGEFIFHLSTESKPIEDVVELKRRALIDYIQKADKDAINRLYEDGRGAKKFLKLDLSEEYFFVSDEVLEAIDEPRLRRLHPYDKREKLKEIHHYFLRINHKDFIDNLLNLMYECESKREKVTQLKTEIKTRYKNDRMISQEESIKRNELYTNEHELMQISREVDEMMRMTKLFFEVNKNRSNAKIQRICMDIERQIIRLQS